MLKIIIKPISNWVGPETKEPKYSQFRQTYSDTKKILESELAKLDVVDSSIQLEMFIHRNDVRQDGELRANCKPYQSGVVLSFTRIKKRYLDKQTNSLKNQLQSLSYPCDTYDDWQDNLRAIALSLQNLRAVSRYGVFKYEEMVSRLSLPSSNLTVDVATALLFIKKYSGIDLSPEHNVPAQREKAFREAAKNTHPDTGGSHELFIQFQDAKKIIEQYYAN